MFEATSWLLSSTQGAAPPRHGEQCAELRTSTDLALVLKRKGDDVNIPQGGEVCRTTLAHSDIPYGVQVGAVPRAVGTAATAQEPVFSKVGTTLGT